VFVLHHNEKPRVIAKQLYASTQRTLGIDGQTVGIEQNNGFKRYPLCTLDIGLGKIFEIIANEFDPLSVRAIDKHHIGLQFVFVASVNLINEIIDQGPLASAVRTVEEQMGDAIGHKISVQFSMNIVVQM